MNNCKNLLILITLATVASSTRMHASEASQQQNTCTKIHDKDSANNCFNLASMLGLISLGRGNAMLHHLKHMDPTKIAIKSVKRQAIAQLVIGGAAALSPLIFDRYATQHERKYHKNDQSNKKTV